MFKLLLAALLACASSASTHAQSSRGFDDSAANLMVVLRESEGVNKQDETLVAMVKAKVRLEDGREVEVDTGWFSYLGDMHIRFVFDMPDSLRSATAQDLARLALTPEAALDLAVQNIRRVYGDPGTSPWNDLSQVKGESPDLDSSYFLDKDFWNAQLKKHPEGLVAMVPKRGGLLFAPLSNARAVAGMKRGVAYLYSSSERLRISSALYLYKDGKWSVLQAPLAAKVRRVP